MTKWFYSVIPVASIHLARQFAAAAGWFVVAVVRDAFICSFECPETTIKNKKSRFDIKSLHISFVSCSCVHCIQWKTRFSTFFFYNNSPNCSLSCIAFSRYCRFVRHFLYIYFPSSSTFIEFGSCDVVSIRLTSLFLTVSLALFCIYLQITYFPFLNREIFCGKKTIHQHIKVDRMSLPLIYSEIGKNIPLVLSIARTKFDHKTRKRTELKKMILCISRVIFFFFFFISFYFLVRFFTLTSGWCDDTVLVLSDGAHRTANRNQVQIFDICTKWMNREREEVMWRTTKNAHYSKWNSVLAFIDQMSDSECQT